MPLAWNAFRFAMCSSQLRYLATRDMKWMRALAAAEVGVLFTTGADHGTDLAKPVWGIQDVGCAPHAHLRAMADLLAISAAALPDAPDGRATLAASSASPVLWMWLVYFAIRWWRTQHPRP